MASATRSSNDPPSDAEEIFEEGSSTEGTTDGYVTPDEEPRGALREADEMKDEGTDYFRTGMWVEALQSYKRGLARLPPRKDTSRLEALQNKANAGQEGGEVVNMDSERDGQISDNDVSHQGEVKEPLSDLDQEYARARSILNGNIGACHVKLGEHKEAIEACTQALLDDPGYVKALHRRATSSDLLGTWSSLASAEEDYNNLLKILPSSSSLIPQIRQALQRVPPRREAAQKAEMAEMMDKLKGLGNSLLGNFGLSTDNFKFEPNGQGGYSMNFVR